MAVHVSCALISEDDILAIARYVKSLSDER